MGARLYRNGMTAPWGLRILDIRARPARQARKRTSSAPPARPAANRAAPGAHMRARLYRNGMTAPGGFEPCTSEPGRPGRARIRTGFAPAHPARLNRAAPGAHMGARLYRNRATAKRERRTLYIRARPPGSTALVYAAALKNSGNSNDSWRG
jgi:hypothetical protein